MPKGLRIGKQKATIKFRETKKFTILCLGQFSNSPMNLRSADACSVQFNRPFKSLQLFHECDLQHLLLQCCPHAVQHEAITAQQNSASFKSINSDKLKVWELCRPVQTGNQTLPELDTNKNKLQRTWQVWECLGLENATEDHLHSFGQDEKSVHFRTFSFSEEARIQPVTDFYR